MPQLLIENMKYCDKLIQSDSDCLKGFLLILVSRSKRNFHEREILTIFRESMKNDFVKEKIFDNPQQFTINGRDFLNLNSKTEMDCIQVRFKIKRKNINGLNIFDISISSLEEKLLKVKTGYVKHGSYLKLNHKTTVE